MMKGVFVLTIMLIVSSGSFSIAEKISPWAVTIDSDSASIEANRVAALYRDLRIDRGDEILSYAGSCLWTGTYDVEVKGEYVFAHNLNGLQVFDISDITDPVLVSQLRVGSLCSPDAVSTLHGDLLLMGFQDALYIVDVADPLNPKVLSSLFLGGVIWEIEMRDDIAFVGIAKFLEDTSDSPGLFVVDVSNPVSPFIVGKYESPHSHNDCRAFVVRDDYLYGINHWNWTIDIVDISDLTQPTCIDTVYIPYSVAITADSSFIYASRYGDEMQIFEIASPESLVLHDVIGIGNIKEMTVNDDKLYIGTRGSTDYTVRVYDIGTPGVLNPLDSAVVRFGGFEFTLFDSLLFVPEIDYGFAIVNMGDMTTTASYSHEIFGFNHVESSGDHAYPLHYYSWHGEVRDGLYTVDISDASTPHLVDYIAIDHRPYSLCLNGSLLAASGGAETIIYSLGDPAHPDSLSKYPFGDHQVFAAEMSGGLLFTIGYSNWIYAADISNPSSPVPLDSIELGDYKAVGGLINGDLAYFVMREMTFKGHLWTVDISNPENLIILDQFYIGEGLPVFWLHGFMEKRGSYIFLAGGALGLCVIDISNPRKPDLAHRYQPYPERCRDIAIKRNLLFASMDYSIHVLDISNPKSPELVQYFPQPSPAYGLSVTWNHLCAGSGSGFFTYQINLSPSDCGDVDGSGGIDIDDIVYLINYVFQGGEPPYPVESGDVDCSGGVDIDDIVYLIAYVFQGGEEPCAEC